MIVQKAAFGVLQDLWQEIRDADPKRSKFELWVVAVNVADSLAKMFSKMGFEDEAATFDWLTEIATIRAAMEQQQAARVPELGSPELALPDSVKNERGPQHPGTPTPAIEGPGARTLLYPQIVHSCLKRPGYGS